MVSLQTSRLLYTLNHRCLLLCIVTILMALDQFGLCQTIGDVPNVKHTSQMMIDAGQISFKELYDLGGRLFTIDFNTLDGYGRPEVNPEGILNELAKRQTLGAARNDLVTRTFGPEANSCVECHNKPFAGGAGGNVTNVFLRSWDAKDPFSVEEGNSNERNTKHIYGVGALQLLAEEISVQLQAVERQAMEQAIATGKSVTRDLRAKGIDFGYLVALPDGTVDKSEVLGIPPDLRIKPFGSKGTVESVRRFTTNPLVAHMGIQAVERLEDDPRNEIAPFHQWDDGDGHENEATRGDVTALVIWQAAQPTPVQRIPDDPEIAQAIANGSQHFEKISCAVCHIPELIINDPTFKEPSRLDPAKFFSFDITRQGPEPRFETTADGKAIVRAYTDLKRHYMGESLRDPLENQEVDAAFFITAELWGIGNTGPWMFNGRAFTLDEAIRQHGGEAQNAREAYVALPELQQRELIEFLKSLVLPPNFQADIQLEKGLNMVSLPLKPYRPIWADQLAQKLDASIVIRFNTSNQQFEGYTQVDDGNGFPIEVGQAYIINAIKSATVTISGDAWHRDQPNIRSFMRAPSYSKPEAKWAFILCGKLTGTSQEQAYTISARNQRTQTTGTQQVLSQDGIFSIVWVGQVDQNLVRVGDTIQMTIAERNQRVIGFHRHIINQRDFDLAYIYKQIRPSDFTPPQTLLVQNYPNPFNPDTWIPYQLSTATEVKIEIYDPLGDRVRVLNLGTKAPGIYFQQKHAAYWNGKNKWGEPIASGVYFYRLTTNSFSQTRKLTIIR